jgi:transposase
VLSALPATELAARLAEAYRVIAEMTVLAGQMAARSQELTAEVGRLSAPVEDFERQARRDSSTSSRPPSSDTPYTQGRDRSLREGGKRRPGKQPGDPGTTMRLVDDPAARFRFRQRCAAGAGMAWPARPCWRSAVIRSPISSRRRRRG